MSDNDDFDDFLLEESEINSYTSEESEDFEKNIIKIPYKESDDPNENLIDEKILEELCNEDNFADDDKICTGKYSIIIEYPIDYENYDLCKEFEFNEMIIEKGFSVIIPENKIFWIFSQPNTYYISHEIEKKNIIKDGQINYLDLDFITIRKNIRTSILPKNFLIEGMDKRFTIHCSDIENISPVYKPYESDNKRKLENVKLRDGIDYMKKKNREYAYIETDSEEYNSLYEDWIIEDLRNTYEIKKKSKLIFNLEKETNDGLQINNNVIIMNVISGSLKIVYTDLSSYDFCYFTYLPFITTKKKK